MEAVDAISPRQAAIVVQFVNYFDEYTALVEARVMALLAQRPCKLRNPRPRRMRR